MTGMSEYLHECDEIRLLVRGQIEFQDQVAGFDGIVELMTLAIRIQQRVPTSTKKAGVAEHPEAFQHVGSLVNEPAGTASLLFI
jgi:hypothetical protein